MYKRLKRILISLIILSIFTINISFAITLPKPELSEEFKEWSKLSEEEKAKVKIPRLYSIEIKDSIIRSKFNNILKGKTAGEIESKYNLAEHIDINVKDQKKSGACWAFASTSILETYMAMKNNNIFDTYSPSHMDYTMARNSFSDGVNEKGFNRYVNDGGNSSIAGAYYASGKGAVLEEDIPFIDGHPNSNGIGYDHEADKIELDRINQDVSKVVKSYKMFPDIYKVKSGTEIKYRSNNSTSGYTSYTEAEVEAVRKEMKQFIKTNGAITASMLAALDYYNLEEVQSGKTDKYAVYCATSTLKAPNHSVTIVGWDDTFSKDNFKSSSKPVHDGAWIILNSWGTSSDKATNEGYIYVSYDDAFVETDMMGIVNVTDVDYDNIYEHDEFGAVLGLALESNNVWAANVFDTKQKESEELKEVGIFLTGTQNVEIYANVTGNDFSKLEKVAEPGILEPGYYTIPLAAPKAITGDKFIVAVKYSNSEGISLPMEFNETSNGIVKAGAEVYDVVTSSPGESYISINGTNFKDILDVNIDEEGTKFKDVNTCVKAYTGKIGPIKVQNITLDRSKLILEEGGTDKLIATIAPENAENTELTWTSSNPGVATVDLQGNITAVAAGECTITVASNETPTIKATSEITVLKKGDFILELDKITAILNKGEEITLKPTFTPTSVADKSVTWKSSDEKIATVDANGKVTAIAEGNATITVTSQANTEKTATCEITVQDKISVQSVSIDITERKLTVGETVKLTATINPTTATDKKITWGTNNQGVADVDQNGNVTAKAPGEATITVTTNDGNKTATSKITVVNKEEPIVKVEKIALNKTQVDIQVGDRTSLVVTFTPANATNKNVTWKMEDETIATVDKNGIITAIEEGTTTLTVTTEDGNIKAVAEINVIENKDDGDEIYDPDEYDYDPDDDPTLLGNNLPASGKATVLTVFIIIAGYGIIRYIKYYKLRDIK